MSGPFLRAHVFLVTAMATRLIAMPSLVRVPQFLAGGIKINYDLVLWRAFASHRPEEEPPSK